MNIFGNKTIILTGMMGSGKTTIGKVLASKIEKDFIDSDQEIINASGLSIQEIFSKFGEEYFRTGERKIIERIMSSEKQIVLSIGGGAFVNKELRKLINTKGVSIWLNANYKTLSKRLKKNTQSRPLFNGYDFKKRLEQLISERSEFYKFANFEIDVNNLSIREIIEKIFKNLENKN